MKRLVLISLVAAGLGGTAQAQDRGSQDPLFGWSERPSQAARTAGLRGLPFVVPSDRLVTPPQSTPAKPKEPDNETDLEFGGEIYFGVVARL